jgi:hypothetical protein
MEDEGFSTLTWFMMVAVPVVLGAGGFYFWRYYRPREEEPLYFRCPGCRHKLRYYARQVGHRGMCSNCKEKFVFPAPLGAAK